MKFFYNEIFFRILVVQFVVIPSALALPLLHGTFGQNTPLTITVTDQHSGPFMAGQIWTSLKPDTLDSQGYRSVKTENFELRCKAKGDPANGVCKFWVSAKKVGVDPERVTFVLNQEEAKNILARLEEGFDSRLFLSGIENELGYDAFLFEENWKYLLVGGTVDKAFLTEN